LLLGVEHIKDRLKLILREDKLGNVPLVHGALMNLSLEARYDAEVMASTAHRPPQIRMRRIRHSDGGSVGQDNVHGDQHVNDQSVKSW